MLPAAMWSSLLLCDYFVVKVCRVDGKAGGVEELARH